MNVADKLVASCIMLVVDKQILSRRYELIYTPRLVKEQVGNTVWTDSELMLMDLYYMTLVNLTLANVLVKMTTPEEEKKLFIVGDKGKIRFVSSFIAIPSIRLSVLEAIQTAVDTSLDSLILNESSRSVAHILDRKYDFPFSMKGWQFVRAIPVVEPTTPELAKLIADLYPLVYPMLYKMYFVAFKVPQILAKIMSGLSRSQAMESMCLCLAFTRLLHSSLFNMIVLDAFAKREAEGLGNVHMFIIHYIDNPKKVNDMIWESDTLGHKFIQQSLTKFCASTGMIANGDKICFGVYHSAKSTQSTTSTSSTMKVSNTQARNEDGGVVSFKVKWVNISTKHNLDQPHVLAFITHDANAIQEKNTSKPSRLEQMYSRCKGQMKRLVDNAASFDLRLSKQPPSDCRIYFLVFYRNTSIKHTLFDEYELESHANMPIQKLTSQPHTSYCISGPMNESLHYDPHNYSIIEAFETLLDSALIVSLDGQGTERFETDIHRATQTVGDARAVVHKAVQEQRLDTGDGERQRIKFFDVLISYLKNHIEGGDPSGQTYAYQAYPTENLDVIAAAFVRTQPDDVDLYDFYIDRAVKAKGFDDEQFTKLCSIVKSGNASEWVFNVFRQTVCMALNIFSVLVYESDVLNGRQVDHMQNIRMTSRGDCEDSAEAIYKWIERFLMLNNFGSESARQLHAVISTLYIPCYTIMMVRYKSGLTMHCVCSLMPKHKFGTSTSSNKILPILLEGTNSTESNFRALSEMNHCLSPQEIIPVEKSVKTANDVWTIIQDASPTNDGWLCPRPPAPYHESFYQGFIAVICKPQGTRAEYYRFAPVSEGLIPKNGVGIVDVMQMCRFRLVNPSPNEQAAFSSANEYIGNFTLPTPLTMPDTMVSGEAEEISTQIEKMCTEYNKKNQRQTITAYPITDRDTWKCGSVSMYLNLTTARRDTEVNKQSSVESLGRILANKGFIQKVGRIEFELIHPTPCVPVVFLTCFLI